MNDANRNAEVELDEVLERMRASVVGAIDAAHKAFAEIVSAARSSEPPPPRQFFTSSIMQLAYCELCGADSKNFKGGDPHVAWHAIKNAVDISNAYWGSKFEIRNE